MTWYDFRQKSIWKVNSYVDYSTYTTKKIKLAPITFKATKASVYYTKRSGTEMNMYIYGFKIFLSIRVYLTYNITLTYCLSRTIETMTTLVKLSPGGSTNL